jgi:hypothetical protein
VPLQACSPSTVVLLPACSLSMVVPLPACRRRWSPRVNLNNFAWHEPLEFYAPSCTADLFAGIGTSEK